MIFYILENMQSKLDRNMTSKAFLQWKMDWTQWYYCSVNGRILEWNCKDNWVE